MHRLSALGRVAIRRTMWRTERRIDHAPSNRLHCRLARSGHHLHLPSPPRQRQRQENEHNPLIQLKFHYRLHQIGIPAGIVNSPIAVISISIEIETETEICHLPWKDISHHHPLELYSIVVEIARRPVALHPNDLNSASRPIQPPETRLPSLIGLPTRTCILQPLCQPAKAFGICY
jgi:hypothetical protein